MVNIAECPLSRGYHRSNIAMYHTKGLWLHSDRAPDRFSFPVDISVGNFAVLKARGIMSTPACCIGTLTFSLICVRAKIFPSCRSRMLEVCNIANAIIAVLDKILIDTAYWMSFTLLLIYGFPCIFSHFLAAVYKKAHRDRSHFCTGRITSHVVGGLVINILFVIILTHVMPVHALFFPLLFLLVASYNQHDLCLLWGVGLHALIPLTLHANTACLYVCLIVYVV